jgi:hypothetical protein
MANTWPSINKLIQSARENNIPLSEPEIFTLKHAAASSQLGKYIAGFRSKQDAHSDAIPVPSESQSVTDQQLYLFSKYQTDTTSTPTRHLNTLYQTQQLSSQHTYHTNVAKVAVLQDELHQRLTSAEKRRQQLRTEATRTLACFDEIFHRLRARLSDLYGNASTAPQGQDFTSLPSSSITTIPDNVATERVEKLLTVLERDTVQEIKDRLDHIYLDALQHPPSSPKPDPSAQIADENVLETLKAEIDTLYTEIPALASMAVSHLHGRPLGRATGEQKTMRKQHRGEALLETKEVLERMTREMECLQRGIEECWSEEIVLGQMLEYVGRIAERVGKASSVWVSKSAMDGVRGIGQGDRSGGMETEEDLGGEEHDSMVKKMQQILGQRKAAVELLVQAADGMSDGIIDSVEEVRAFEKRVDVIKDKMTEAAR